MIADLKHPLRNLQQRIPVVGDKALVDLVNGISVSNDIVRYRNRRSFLTKLVDDLTGKSDKLQWLLDANLVTGQSTLHQWVLELCDSLQISHVALRATQESLLEARSAIRRQHERLCQHESKFQDLSRQIEQLESTVGRRLDDQEKRLQRLEVRLAARDDFERIFAAWASGLTYSNLSWVIQIVLLAREVFSSTVISYELESGDINLFRQLLINKIIAESRQMPRSFFGLAELLDQTWEDMNSADRGLIAGLLEVRSVAQQRIQNTPYLFAVGTSLELAVLPNDARPTQPAQCAIELCRSQIDLISYATDTRSFVTQIVEETANDCRAIMLGGSGL